MTRLRDDCAAARSFLTHGTWTNASSSQLLPQHPACRINVHSRVWRYSSSWEGNTLKYKGAPACINHPHVQWLPDAAPRRVPRLIDAVPLGITLWFIGDSTSIEHAQSAACRIASEDEQTVWTDWYTPDWANGTSGIWSSGGFKISCIRGGSSTNGLRAGKGLPDASERQVCFVPSVSRDARVSTAASVLQRLQAIRVTRDADLIICNVGAWYMGHGVDVEPLMLKEVAALLRVLHSCPPPCPRILWRETFAQHFDTPDGVYRPNTLTSMNVSHRDCKAPRHDISKPKTLSAVAATLLEAGIETLDGWQLTKARHYSHVTKKDCTHYCVHEGGRPGSVFDALNDALAMRVVHCGRHDLK